MKGNKNYYRAIPILFQLVGLMLYWLKIDQKGIMLMVGFLGYGLYYLREEIKGNTIGYFRVVRILLTALVILLALQGIIQGELNFVSILVAITMYNLITKRVDLLLKKS